MSKKGVNWKTIAIIFIILFVLETSFFIWAYSLGSKELIRQEQAQLRKERCSIVVCEGYDAFLYDDELRVCDCYLNKEVAHTEFMNVEYSPPIKEYKE
ncbi:MAG: hypothetical protein KJ600_05110 [Nanoarchaeota archaeon]|nr:hypothetical protein [Nanoarchaeota archaeon]MBU1103910.1 hypothetical protein [Nanoarchaeota archaeon]